MDDPDQTRRSRLQKLSPLGPAKPRTGKPPESPQIDRSAEASSGPGHGWRGAFGPQGGPAITQQLRQTQQANALQRAANAAFASVAALDADTQLSFGQRVWAVVSIGLALWRHCKEAAPFQDPRQFGDWIDQQRPDLASAAATLAAHAVAPDRFGLTEQIEDDKMLAVAAGRTPQPWVRDYWKRLGATTGDTRPGVFLSYAHVDVVDARELKTALNPEVLVVLDDEFLRYGERWWDVLGKAITLCKATLVLVSPTAMASDNVKREISAATNRHDRTDGQHLVVPVFLAEVDDLPMPLLDLHGIFVQREGGMVPTAHKLKAQLVAS